MAACALSWLSIPLALFICSIGDSSAVAAGTNSMGSPLASSSGDAAGGGSVAGVCVRLLASASIGAGAGIASAGAGVIATAPGRRGPARPGKAGGNYRPALDDVLAAFAGVSGED